jgi:hypothetical protein
VIDELLAGASTEEEIVGPGGLLAQLTKRLVGASDGRKLTVTPRRFASGCGARDVPDGDEPSAD